MAGEIDLHKHRSVLARELTDTCQQLRALKRKRHTCSRMWILTERMQNVCIIAYKMSSHNSEAACKFLKASARERHWPACDEVDVRALVHRLYAAADADRIGALTNLDNPLDAGALSVALRFVRESYVVERVRTVNAARGIAPSSAWVLERAEEFANMLPPHWKPRSFGTAREGRSQKWLRQLRLKWNGRLRSIPPIEPLSEEEFQSKANHSRLFSRVSGVELFATFYMIFASPAS